MPEKIGKPSWKRSWIRRILTHSTRLSFDHPSGEQERACVAGGRCGNHDGIHVCLCSPAQSRHLSTAMGQIDRQR